jgi:hypothetical protein
MNTRALEKFAQAARRQLHEQVEAKLDRVLETDSAELRAQTAAIQELEKQIAQTSREAVIERVAYTWFNRFCALRYMDVNHYTRMGTVSPAAGYTQPEILQEAKQGHIDERFERYVDQETVFGLLSGRLPAEDPQQEAYRLLLVAVCNYYHSIMPLMFQRIDDYTELLMPDDLLSVGSILQAMREALTPEACQDVEVIGWLYQFYISEKKDEVIGSKKPIQPEDIPAATQLFTPHWIVRYLVENSLGRLWLLNRPNSRLAERMDYYIQPEHQEADFLRLASPEELRICDPACGSGHMLTYSFDLLYAIYEEEGYNPSDIPRLVLEENLYGIEIDERAGALAAFVLAMKARERDRRFFQRDVRPHVCVLHPIRFKARELTKEPWLAGLGADLRHKLLPDLCLFEQADNFGSLLCPQLSLSQIAAVRERVLAGMTTADLFTHDRQHRVLRALEQAEYLVRKYHVVVANPPYMGSGNMNVGLKKFAKDNYHRSKFDLCAIFIERNLELAEQCGLTAMITTHSWMFLSSFERLRKKVLERWTVLSMAHLGARAFNTISGEVVSTTAFVIFNGEHPAHRGSYLRLISGNSEAEKQQMLRANIPTKDCSSPGEYYLVSASDLKEIPRAPIAYWISPKIRELFSISPLSRDFESGGRCKSHKDSVYVRYGWEVNGSRIPAKWKGYHKGGDARKWYGNLT